MFELLLTDQAQCDLEELENNPADKKRLNAVRKTLGYLQTNPRHPGLRTHKFSSLIGADGEEVFEAYAQNKTLGAYRVFWYYEPEKKQITVFAITPHP